MPLSISNSNLRLPTGHCRKQWLLVIVFTVILVVIFELYLRSLGCMPQVKDSSSLWGYYRQECDRAETSNMLVSIGGSRPQAGLNPFLVASRTNYSNVVLLHQAGSSFIPTLRDIAYNTDYSGMIICSYHPLYFLYSMEEQQALVDFYHAKYNNSILTSLLTNIDTYLNLQLSSSLVINNINGISGIASKILSSKRSNMKKYPNRFMISETSLLEAMSKEQLSQYKKERAVAGVRFIVGNDVSIEDLPVDHDKWFACFREVLQLAKIIEDRGGKFIFVRYPISDDCRRYEQEKFPKELYWDEAARMSPVLMLHFQDIPGCENLSCFDGSHLSEENANIFTNRLIEELIKTGVMEPKLKIENDKAQGR